MPLEKYITRKDDKSSSFSSVIANNLLGFQERRMTEERNWKEKEYQDSENL